jgi:hypothetical protein
VSRFVVTATYVSLPGEPSDFSTQSSACRASSIALSRVGVVIADQEMIRRRIRELNPVRSRRRSRHVNSQLGMQVRGLFPAMVHVSQDGCQACRVRLEPRPVHLVGRETSSQNCATRPCQSG